MEDTEPALQETRVGPAERPDDPLAAARRKAVRWPLSEQPRRPIDTAKTAPPSKDQEGCYYLG